jgi:DNA recombination protein RmuC
MDIIFLIAGIIIGLLAGYFVVKGKQSGLISRIEEKDKLLIEKEKAIASARAETGAGTQKIISLSAELSEAKANYTNLEQKLAGQKSELEELQSKFTKEFENLAAKILEDKSRRFTEQNKENLDTILNPLKEKIAEFEKKVSDVYVNETRERAALAEQLKNLNELNRQMSEEAVNLTRALKGDSRSQGTWGEFILESILEKSGLVKGREFFIQETVKNEEGSNLRPDVIVKMPDEKSMIVDSKVSLTAYEAFNAANDENEKKKYLSEHIGSIRRHIKGLSPKSYQNLYGINSLDFVLMFIPIEPAFSIAQQNDQSLFYDAFEKNIVIVTPTTLLVTLRTISSIWKQEKQTKNALEIAKKGGELYDKLSAFVEDLIKVGQRMDDTKKSYEEAMNKLADGKGNIVSRAQNLKLMGVKATKSIDQRIVDRAVDDDNEPENIDAQMNLL